MLYMEFEKERLILKELTEKVLYIFSSNANRQTLHPLDLERWYKFVYTAFSNEQDFKYLGDDIYDYLINDGWSENDAEKMFDMYIDEVELLDYMKQEHII